MTRSSRKQTVAALKQLWDALDVPPIPQEELDTFTDATITLLVRHWQQKRLAKEREVRDGAPTAKCFRASFLNCRQTGGGYMTPRQFACYRVLIAA